jgi:hypothetical protein
MATGEWYVPGERRRTQEWLASVDPTALDLSVRAQRALYFQNVRTKSEAIAVLFEFTQMENTGRVTQMEIALWAGLDTDEKLDAAITYSRRLASFLEEYEGLAALIGRALVPLERPTARGAPERED